MSICSVVILTYNKIVSIHKVIEAINSPKVGEIILCDDCSDDGTFEWAQKSGKFTKTWKKDKHDHYALNTLRNKGVELSSFDYVVLLDGDCVPEPGLFDGHIKVLESNELVISIGFTHHYDESGVTLQRFDNRIGMLKGESIGPIPWCECFGGNMAFSKKVYNLVGNFDENFNGYWGFDDIDFGFRATKSGVKLMAHQETIAKHLAHPQKAVEHGNCYGRNYKLLINKHGRIYS
jgi:glycosyltransferase involved in cell wall biosynthesis